MSDSIQTIPVRTAPDYAVSIGPGLLTSCGQRLREVLGPCRAAVIADSTVAPLYARTVTASSQRRRIFRLLLSVPRRRGPQESLHPLGDPGVPGPGASDPHRLRGGPGRRRGRRHGGLCRRRVPPGHPLRAAAHHAALPPWIPPWAARPPSTLLPERTWPGPFSSPPPCCATPTV